MKFINDTVSSSCKINRRSHRSRALIALVLFCSTLVIVQLGNSTASAVGTWVTRGAVTGLRGMAIPSDGEKYLLARGASLQIPTKFGANFQSITNLTAFSAISTDTTPSSSHCIAGLSDGRVIVSTNSCQSWGPKTLTSPFSTSVVSVATSDNGTTMIAATSGDGIWVSTNTGGSFTEKSQAYAWTDIAVDSTGAEIVGVTSDGLIVRSTDTGTTFSSIGPSGIARWNAVTSSSDGEVLLAGSDSGELWKSSNAGSTWSQITVPNSGSVPIADIAMSSDASKILIGLNGGKLLLSADGGSSWSEEDSVRNWTTVAMSPSGVHMGAGTADNFYTSSTSLEIVNASPTTPLNGATGVLNNQKLILHFNNRITLGSGKNLYIKKTSDNSIFETIPLSDARITLNTINVATALPITTAITVNPSGTFALSTSYYLETDASAITDDHGNVFDLSQTPFQFTTSSSDTAPPTVESKDPSNSNVRASSNVTFSITFSEDVRAVNGKYLRVCFASLSPCGVMSEYIPVTDTSRITISQGKVTINPEMEMQQNSSYDIGIDAGAFEDLHGNPFAGISQEGDINGFGIYSYYEGGAPAFRRACMSTDRTKIHMVFDEKLQGGTVNASEFAVTVGGVSQAISSVTIPDHSAHATITLGSALSENSSPMVSYTKGATGSIRDSTPSILNSVPATDASSTTDCAGPLLASVSPSATATAVPINTNISLTFDEPIQTQLGKRLSIYNKTASSLIENIDTNASNRVVITGNTLTIDPTNDLPANSQIAVSFIASGFVEDTNGNDFWGWEGTSVYVFTTGSSADSTAPVASLTTANITSADNAVAESTETGTLYLVNTSLTVNNVASITGAASNLWNSAAVTTANTATNISASGLITGTYKAYAVDAVGNLSSASSGTVTVGTPDSTPPLAPNRPTLASSSDTGISSSDGITRDVTPEIEVISQETGGTVTITAVRANSSDVTCTMAGSTSGDTCTLGTLSSGTWLVTARHADTAGNQSPITSALTIVVDTNAPTITAKGPTHNATAVSRRPVVVLQFSEDVVAIAGRKLRVRDFNAVTDVEVIDGGAAAVSVSGDTATISTATKLDPNKLYSLYVDYVPALFIMSAGSGMFEDLAGNVYTGIECCTDWQFTTTSDNTVPSATWSSPTSPTTSRTLQFDTVFSETVTGFDASDISISGTATGCSAAITGSGTNYSVTVTCSSVGTVSLELSANTVIDLGGNDGPLVSTSSASVVIDNPAPDPAPASDPGTSSGGTTSTTTTIPRSVASTPTTAPTNEEEEGTSTTVPQGEDVDDFDTSVTTVPPEVPVVDLDLDGTLVIKAGTPAIVVSGPSIVRAANSVGVNDGRARLRARGGNWEETTLPDPSDVTVTLNGASALDVEFAPLVGEVVRISVPLEITVDNNGVSWWLVMLIAVLSSIASYLLVFLLRRRRND